MEETLKPKSKWTRRHLWIPHHIVYTVHLLSTIRPLGIVGISLQDTIFDKCTVNNPDASWKMRVQCKQAPLLYLIGPNISWASAMLYNVKRATFYWKYSNPITSLCFKHIMKLSKRCLGVDFVGLPPITLSTHVLRALSWTLGYTRKTNSSILYTSTFVKTWTQPHYASG